MGSIPDAARSLALPEFCAAVANRHGSSWPPTEDRLARDFLAHFGISRFAHYDELVKWCEAVGVEFSTAELPRDLLGLNCWHENVFSIVMPSNGGCFISRDHTLLHELREVLEGVFGQLGQPTTERDALECRAEQFAACVRMAVWVESSKDLFQIASAVRNPVGRACAYGLVGAVTAALVVSCVGVRQLEVQLDAQRPYRPT